ncbi:MAG: hypothetical protein RL885_29805 [Planctomycetota bacterium]
MPKLRKMSTAGDHIVAEWSLLKRDTFEQARKELHDELKKGCSAFRIEPGGGSTLITDIDPEVDADVLIVPPVTGG